MTTRSFHEALAFVLVWGGAAALCVAAGVVGARLSMWLDRRRDKRRGWPS